MIKIALFILLLFQNPAELTVKENNWLKESDKLRIEKACKKMGPLYSYKISPGLQLKVKLNGEWKKLN